MQKINPLVVVGIPTWGKVSIAWAQAHKNLNMPLGASASDLVVQGQPIATARNEIVRQAVDLKANYVFFKSDDVLPPPNAFLQMWHKNVDIVTGIYWTKGYPSDPYIWRGLQRGCYRDWKVGEFFEIDWAGCDCLLVKIDVFKNLEEPWFTVDWVWERDHIDNPYATEDFPFFVKAKQAGYKIWADTSVQCLHEDRTSGQMFGVTTDMPQWTERPEALIIEDEQLLIADLGCGYSTPFFENAKVVRIDIREEVKPDIRCDLRAIPDIAEKYDQVHCRHALEHFKGEEAPKLIREWARILKIGGKLVINVPDLEYACEHILKAEHGEETPDFYPWWQLYGQQAYDQDIHYNGFTAKALKKLLGLDGEFDRIDVRRESPNLVAEAVKIKSWKPPVLGEEFRQLQADGRTTDRFNQETRIIFPKTILWSETVKDKSIKETEEHLQEETIARLTRDNQEEEEITTEGKDALST